MASEKKSNNQAPSFAVNDRVIKLEDPGVQGLVKEIRTETSAKQDVKEKAQMIQVLWDNGTLSYFSPESLKKL